MNNEDLIRKYMCKTDNEIKDTAKDNKEEIQDKNRMIQKVEPIKMS